MSSINIKGKNIFVLTVSALIFASPRKKAIGSVGSKHPALRVGRVGGSNKYWEFSSAGSEHLPYKQRVGGSIPSTPTVEGQGFQRIETLFYLASFAYNLHTF